MSLDQVKNLIAGRGACIISGVVNRDNNAVADKLGEKLMVSVVSLSVLLVCTCAM